MKTAIYIEDRTVQLVITPESEFEKNALASFRDKPMAAEIFTGAFYDCRGGWIRHKEFYPDRQGYGSNDTFHEQSLILRHSEPKEPVAAPEQQP